MLDDVQKMLKDTQRLQALYRAQLIDTPTEATFDRLTQLAHTVLEAPISLISLVEPERQFFKSQVGLPEPWASQRETPISHSFCKHVVASGDPLIIEDARDHPLVWNNPAIQDLNVVSYLGIPLTSPDGWQLGSFCIIADAPRHWTQQDIATMKALAESVTTEITLRMEVRAKEAALEELQARNAELDAFSHTVSHNLKNPISAIVGWASVSTQYADRMSLDELLEAIKKMGDLANHTNDIINALLLLAKVNRSEDVPCQELNMFNIVDDALSRLANVLTDNDVTVQLPPAESFPRCVGYRPWIEEVWMNYISNAIKYGGQPPVIAFGAEQESAESVRYWIRDNGKGLSPEEQRMLFVPFNRLPKTAKIEGHGLGLSIVQRIIEKLGGEVGVSSEAGAGSTFSFTLPTQVFATD